LTRPGTFEPTQRLDVFFDYLHANDKKIKNRALVRFHTGTTEVMARLILPDRDAIEPGGKAYAQLFLAAPAVVMAGDRFVIPELFAGDDHRRRTGHRPASPQAQAAFGPDHSGT